MPICPGLKQAVSQRCVFALHRRGPRWNARRARLRRGSGRADAAQGCSRVRWLCLPYPPAWPGEVARH